MKTKKEEVNCEHDFEFVGCVGGAYCHKCGQWDEACDA